MDNIESLKKQVSDLPKRLAFLKERLELTQKDIYTGTGMRQSAYNHLEGSGRSCRLEHFIILEKYFDNLWQVKYSKHRNYPFYKGNQLEDITVSWLICGSDYFVNKTNRFLECVQEDFRRKEYELFDDLVTIKARDL